MATQKNLNSNIVTNFLGFLLVTRTVPFDTRFNGYGFSKRTETLKSILDRSVAGAKPQIWGTRSLKISEGWIRILQVIYSTFQRILTRMNPVTTVIVTAIQRQQPRGVSAEKSEIDLVRMDRKLGVIADFDGDYNF
jgi:hypothetical protein